MMKNRILLICFLISSMMYSQSIEKVAESKMKTLQSLVKDLKRKNIDTEKEEMTLQLAKVFLFYANWDEKNIAINTSYFKKVSNYKNKAEEMATILPDFERKDVVLMLDEAIKIATDLSLDKIFRKSYEKINWSKIKHKEDQLYYKNRPVFLSDYTWKPDVKELEKYFGQLDVGLISPPQVNKFGKVNKNILNKIEAKGKGTAGFVFIGHNKPGNWSKEVYGADFVDYGGEPFFHYDIDNPGAKKIISDLFKETIPLLADKNYTQLGYMLANEPRWLTYKNGGKKVWYSVPVSIYSKEKFTVWLQKKHKNIQALNKLWKTNFTNFNEVTIDIPIDISLMGTPKWYDWTAFNEDRVTDWFTFMKKEIRKYDKNAKVHLKIMPSFFTDNDPATGIDLEALTELSDINGNDVAAHYNYIRKGKAEWENKYIFGWRELYMGYDFLKSVQPNQINFNSESHLLSTSSTRDLYMNPKYVRATYWAAHLLGMNAVQTWYWPRRENGSIRGRITSGYGGSNNQQPRVTRELQNTIIDLNTFSEDIVAFQRQRKPIRIFYSKTSANQKAAYMDEVFEVYESLNFDGIPLGFVTKNILNKEKDSNWDVVVIYSSEKVTQSEFNAVQEYLNAGGTVIIDDISLLKNEYGKPLKTLSQGKGTLIKENSIEEITKKALTIVDGKKGLPIISLTEKNSTNFKGCTWRFVTNSKGQHILSVINLGKTNANLEINFKNSNKTTVCRDIVNNVTVPSKTTLKPYEVLFVEVLEK